MSKTSNQLAKTSGVSFNKTDAERIAAAVVAVEDGGRVSLARTATPNPSRVLTKLFIVESSVSCGKMQGTPARWVECETEGGCGYNIEEIPRAESVELVDNSMVFSTVPSSENKVRYVEAKWVPAFDAAKKGSAGFWQITNVIYCNGCPSDDCEQEDGACSSSTLQIGKTSSTWSINSEATLDTWIRNADGEMEKGEGTFTAYNLFAEVESGKFVACLSCFLIAAQCE